MAHIAIRVRRRRSVWERALRILTAALLALILLPTGSLSAQRPPSSAPVMTPGPQSLSAGAPSLIEYVAPDDALDAANLNGAVKALIVDAPGALYAGGEFTGAGGPPLNHVARWTGSQWQALGVGVGGPVFALAKGPDGSLYAGGNFYAAGGAPAANIARWDGSNWAPLGAGVNGPVYALAFDSAGNLYVGGEFTQAGGLPASGIAKWDGATWSALGAGVGGLSYPYVHALLWDNSQLYAGGRFTSAGGVAVNHIARWDGTAWSALADGVGDGVSYAAVYALLRDSSGGIIAAGDFPKIGATTVGSIARWNGSAWQPLGTGVNGWIWELANDASGNLYAGGDFSQAGGTSAQNVTKWNGSNWGPLGTGTNDAVVALATVSGRLVAGGEFAAPASYIAVWDGSVWRELLPGAIPSPPPIMNNPGDENWSDEFGLPWINAAIYAMTADEDAAGGVFIGGDFTGSYDHIAHWDGSQWRSLGSGMNGRVSALVRDTTGNLYAGGSFTTAGGVSARHIAKWNGSNWSPLGQGINGDVLALATDGSGNLYAGGFFTMAGSGAASNLARWDGSAWYPLGSGTDANVLALATGPGNVLYAGGAFTHAGGTPTNYIARWNGVGWSALGSGMGDTAYPYVHALAVDASGALYAGGAFATAGGTAGNGIARWNGSSWSALGAGVTGGPVRALAVSPTGDVTAAGGFTMAGGSAANRVARWADGRWHALGGEMSDTVHALAPRADVHLYAGGEFTSPSRFFTRWDGVRWRAYGAGLDGESANGLLLAPDEALIVGGRFNHAGVETVNAVARWDGAQWSTFGGGFRQGVGSMVINRNGDLDISGDFGGSVIGGLPYMWAARWNGVAWGPLGSELHYGSYLALDPEGKLYAGGGMTTPYHGWVARWDGTAWQPMGAGDWFSMNSWVSRIAIDSAGAVYAGGDFTTAGSQPVRHIARWDGAAWRQIGDIGHTILDVHFDPAGNLWAAGDGVISRWDGATWQTVGATQAAYNVDVDRAGRAYASGRFETINGTPFSNIGMWDGAVWRPLGSGIVGNGWWAPPYMPAGQDQILDAKGNLFIVGFHHTAGGKPSSHIARWTASDYRPVTGPGSYTLYADNLPVTINVTQQGTLARLDIQRHDKSHPSAGSGLDTGYFWEIVGVDAAGNLATGYTVDVAIPTAFNPDGADRVCRYTGSTWDCAAASHGELFVTRTGITNLTGFWATQDNVPPPPDTPTPTATATATATPTATGTTAPTATATATQTTIAPTARRSYLPLIVKN